MPKMISNGILVDVISYFVPEKSNPMNNYYFFAYKVRITNNGSMPAQLKKRHWVITDAAGRRHEVKGEGVVGEQPKLDPGMSFEYTSFCPLPTPSGNMQGSYEMEKSDGTTFTAMIPMFVLFDDSAVN